MSGKVILTDYKYDPNTRESSTTWLVRHTSRQLKRRITTLEQQVSMSVDRFGGRTPKVCLDEFPRDLTERESMLKLADWLHRLSVSIEDHWSEP
nr:hypothetical protein [Rosenbergiella epipactidis]